MRRRAALAAALLFAGGSAVAGRGMTGHMTAHMAAVALAAPLLALATAGSTADPARWRPGVVAPLSMSLVELVAVWAWHVPALRHAVGHGPAAMLAEQLCFLGAGWLLWSAVLNHRAQGVAALLLTSMHMTLLGALIGLAPRPLYMTHAAPFGLTPLEDQQLGGAVMLLVGGASYLLGALAVLAPLLRGGEARPA